MKLSTINQKIFNLGSCFVFFIESVTSNDELPSYTDGKLNKTGGFYGDGFDPGKNSENRPATKLKTRSTSCYEEDSETESLQSNSEHKSKS